MADLLHLKSPENWMNDPNGFIYFKEKYHLFYQYFPYGTEWGTMHWGHAVSEDLISWEHLGIALYPTKSYDRNGVFSGSAVDIDGVLHIYYTGASYQEQDPENIQKPVDWHSFQSQVMITSEDGYNFDNINGKKQIIPVINDREIADPMDCRDPKVWKENGRYFMCLASTRFKKKGVLLIYESEDSLNWKLMSVTEDETFGEILECPDMFSVDGNRMLVSSPIGILKNTEYPENQTTIRFADFDSKTGKVTVNKKYQFLDYGMDIYASQSNLDKDGNRTMISWIRMPEPKPLKKHSPVRKEWIGMMTLPRIVEVRDGVIYTRPHDSVRRFFEKEKNKGTDRQLFASLRNGESLNIDGIVVSLKDGCVCVDRSERLPKSGKLHAVSRTPFVGEECRLEIYDSEDVIEIYVNDGRYVITNVKY